LTTIPDKLIFTMNLYFQLLRES